MKKQFLKSGANILVTRCIFVYVFDVAILQFMFVSETYTLLKKLFLILFYTYFKFKNII